MDFSLNDEQRAWQMKARKFAADFNAFGKACNAEGIRFGYHPHGFEFTPTGAARG